MSYLPDSSVTYIVQHYSATPIEDDYTVADIDRMHKNRGFREVGYHYYIRKDGTVETGRDLSQPGRFEMGAHSKGENDESIGICCEGGVTRAQPTVGFDSRTPEQIKSQVALIIALLERFPNAVVKGHRDMPGAATQCPGYNASAWWDGIIATRQRRAFMPETPLPRITPLPTVEPLTGREPTIEALSQGRDSVWKSTTIMAQVRQFGANIGLTFAGAWGAWQTADDTTKYIIAAFVALAFIVAMLGGATVFKERIRYWSGGLD